MKSARAPTPVRADRAGTPPCEACDCSFKVACAKFELACDAYIEYYRRGQRAGVARWRADAEAGQQPTEAKFALLMGAPLDDEDGDGN